MRSSYWSQSKFANWLRKTAGLTSPDGLTSAGWRQWGKKSKEISPFIHWFTDGFLDSLQNFFSWPKDRLWDVRCAINARFFDKYHYLPTRLNPWQYHEVDTRVLHGLFETLVDFIEIEKAWMHVIWGQEENRKKHGYSWFEMNGWFRPLFERRHPLAGIEYLEWEMSLITDDAWYGNDEESIKKAKEAGEYGKMTSQALAAKEQFELYHWWKHIRPNRPDPYDESGYSAYFKKLEEVHGDDFFVGIEEQTPEMVEESRKCSKTCHEIEEAYEKEDEEMLIRLIKIRRSLWT